MRWKSCGFSLSTITFAQGTDAGVSSGEQENHKCDVLDYISLKSKS